VTLFSRTRLRSVVNVAYCNNFDRSSFVQTRCACVTISTRKLIRTILQVRCCQSILNSDLLSVHICLRLITVLYM